jgi:hypothetical protein
MSENVIASSDVAPVKVPKSFNDLKIDELRAAARAFGSDETGNKDAIKADLLEFGVTFDQYLQMFYPNEAVDVEPEAFEMPEPIDVEDWPDAEEEVNEIETLITAPEVDLAPAEKYLVKFVGENPYFEFGNYKFTTAKPYGVMPARDAQEALVNEPTKFRQAFPQELEEFYG